MSENAQTNTNKEAPEDSNTIKVRELQAKLVDTEKKLEQFKNINPNEFFAIKTELERRIKENPTDVDLDKIRKIEEEKVRKEIQEELDKKEALLKRREGELKNLKVTSKVMGELSDIVADDAKIFVQQIVEKYCDLDEKDQIIIKNDAGEVRRIGADKLFGVSDLKEELKNKFPSLIKASTIAGTKSGTKVSVNASDLTLEKYLSMSKEERQQLPSDVQYRLSSKALGGR